MNILESEIEDIIWNAIEEYDHNLLQQRGLPILPEFSYRRQYELGGYGRADMIGIRVTPSYVLDGKKRRDVYIQVFELKKGEINTATFWQAVRYVQGLRHKILLEKMPFYFDFSIHLVGKCIDKHNEFPYLPNIFDNVHLYTYDLSLTKGLVFNKHKGYTLTKHNLKEDSKDIMDLIRDNVEDNTNNEREGISIRRFFKERDERIARGELLPTDDQPF